ncbi:unnamed protein product [Calypogeia fissa]
MAFGMATALHCAPCIGTAPRDIAVSAVSAQASSAAAVPSLSKNFSGLHCIDLSSSAASSSSSSLCNATTIQVRRAGAVRTARPQSQKSRTLAVVAAKEEVKDILILGGTRFIGLFLARLLVKEGYSVTLLTRGKSPVTKQLPGETDEEYAAYSSQVKHIKADRQDFEALKETLSGKPFTHVYDINGREATETEPILESLPELKQYIFCSSAGVYKKSDLLPHREIDEGDPKSRHKGKLDTEALLESKGVAWTSIRPVYIYGPLNYNPVEEWFFHRLAAGRPIPVPSSGLQVTQLGHVKDLADAFVKVLANEKTYGQVYNISGERYVTFDGIAKAAAKAGGFPEPDLIHYNPKEFDFGKKKAFPLRDQHFFTSIEKAEKDFGWKPTYGLLEGLVDSYSLDFGRGTFRKAANFETDDMILGKLGLLEKYGLKEVATA